MNTATGESFIFLLPTGCTFVKLYTLYEERKRNVINQFWGFQNNVSVPEQLKNISFSVPVPFLVNFHSFSVFFFVP